MPQRIRTIVFDVNETLLDLNSLDGHFERLFQDTSVKSAWFGQLLQSSMVATMTGHYQDFCVLAEDALQMIASHRGLHLEAGQTGFIRQAFAELQPHPELKEALTLLSRTGYRLATFTNTPPDVHQAQLAFAGITSLFEQMLTVDPVKKFKPAAETYAYAAQSLGNKPEQILFVAAHHWDIAGATQAGFQTAFIARAGKVLSRLQKAPDFYASDLLELARLLS